MAYTTHGHHIPKSTTNGPFVGSVHRCGGPTMCDKCAREVVHFISNGGKISDDFPTPRNDIEGLKVERYQRKTFDVDAVQVTEHNLDLVAAWCGGSIVTEQVANEENALLPAPPKRYVLVPVAKPLSKRQTEAYIGDWVLWADRGFKVYGQKPFLRSFIKPKDIPVELLTTTETV
ncbi:gp092 [Rhodococcus phage ReqiPoco6]|uniref:Gp092 n=1 Tax=Rhodococcus phage ReqiPoco6 TaxID=691964 RepID=D4P7W0_9CAUD|nr:gp092 [Rhodococcus phage ReqiPoco6]ADD81090.1 gp092 [Rhodococcus phage ReqiPoco6]